MKKLTILYILLATSIAAHSQAFSAYYDYDPNGNRKIATILWLQSSLKSDILDSSETKAITSLNDSIPNNGYSKPNIDSLSNVHITIYPNPTHGILLVTVQTHGNASLFNGNASLFNGNASLFNGNASLFNGNESNETHGNTSLQTSISVYSSTGQQVFYLSPLARTNAMNLQSQPAGTYIMTIQLGTLSKTYTIIKN